MNWVDWLVCALLIIAAFKGFRRGAVAKVFSFAGCFVGFVLARWYTAPLSLWLEQKFHLTSGLSTVVAKLFSFSIPVSGMGNYIAGMGANKITGIGGAANQVVNRAVPDVQSGALAAGGTSIAPYMFASALVELTVFLAIFGALQLVGEALGRLVHRKLNDGDPPGGLDRTLGAILGMAETGFLIVALLGVLPPLLLYGPGGKVLQAINQSVLVNYCLLVFTGLAGWLGKAAAGLPVF